MALIDEYNSKEATMKISKSIVLLISIFFPPEIGGGSTGAWNRAMSFHKIGYSVFVLSGFPAYPSGKVSDIKYKRKFFYVESLGPFIVIRFRLIPLQHTGMVNRFIIFFNFIFLTIFFMPRILKITGKIDITYARAPILFSSLIGFLYAKFTDSFFILEMPDLWPEELVNIKSRLSFLITIFGKPLAKLSYSFPDVIVTVSKLAAYRISEEYKPRAPVYGVPVGVDQNKFPMLSKKDSKIELIKNGIFPSHLKDKFIVLYSGLISAAQQVENLVFAAEKLKNEKEISFVIIGEGPQKQILEQLKIKLGLENLFLIPAQPRNLMPTIISSSDMCVITLSSETIFQIAIPTKFYEYLACKKPLIGVCKGELENIINSTKIGRTVLPGNVDQLAFNIKYFKNSPILLQTMEDNCTTTLQRFSLENIASDFLEILKKEMKKSL